MEYAIVVLFSPIAFFYGFDVFTTFKDYKTIDINEIKKLRDKINPYTNVDLSKIKNLDLRNYVDNFSNVVLSNFNYEDLNSFFYNINNYSCDEVIKKRLSFTLIGINASYNPKNNDIEFGLRDFSNCINHELFHMASSKTEGKYSASGFNLIDNSKKLKSIGVGINEGYTQLLAERYFNEDDYVSNSYQYMVMISIFLEKIIGKEKMQSLYMTGNLLGLIDELKKFINEENVMRFLTDTDFIVKNFPLRDMSFVPTKDKKINSSIDRITKFLVETNSMLNGFDGYKKEDLFYDITSRTNLLLPSTYKRKQNEKTIRYE